MCDSLYNIMMQDYTYDNPGLDYTHSDISGSYVSTTFYIHVTVSVPILCKYVVIWFVYTDSCHIDRHMRK